MLFYEDLSEVVLVGHSYGGMVITGVAATQYNREGGECLTKRKPVDVIAFEELQKSNNLQM